MRDYDELPPFERFHRKGRKLSARRRRTSSPHCLHKQMYWTAAKAEQARMRQLAKGAPFLRVYRCDDCRSWHLTHKP